MNPAAITTDIDILRSISIIEKLKCEILSETARLFKSMNEHGEADNKEILSKLLTNVYLLAERIGISPEALDASALKKLKAQMLSRETDEPHSEENKLLEYLRRDKP